MLPKFSKKGTVLLKKSLFRRYIAHRFSYSICFKLNLCCDREKYWVGNCFLDAYDQLSIHLSCIRILKFQWHYVQTFPIVLWFVILFPTSCTETICFTHDAAKWCQVWFSVTTEKLFVHASNKIPFQNYKFEWIIDTAVTEKKNNLERTKHARKKKCVERDNFERYSCCSSQTEVYWKCSRKTLQYFVYRKLCVSTFYNAIFKKNLVKRAQNQAPLEEKYVCSRILRIDKSSVWIRQAQLPKKRSASIVCK